MRKTLFSIGLMACLAAVAVQTVQSHSRPSEQASTGNRSGQNEGKAQPDRSADDTAIRANIAQFEKAFNAKDAKAVAALFTSDGQIENKVGDQVEGREAILAKFAEIFASSPQKRIDVMVETIRFIGAELAVEVGTTKEVTAPGEPPEFERYTVLHVKRDGKWQMALARDEEGPAASGREQLMPLAWLVGEWVDDGGSVVVRSTCRWSDDKNFLLQEFNLQLNGRDAMNVSQRIGWDPHAKRIRAWVFDSEGGFGESVWIRDGNNWIIKATGVRPDGTLGSATNVLTRSGADGYIWQATDRNVGDEVQPPLSVKVVRKPPMPNK